MEIDEQYPWEDVDEARRNPRLQKRHPISEAGRYIEDGQNCPKCGKSSRELAWFYFESPSWTWEELCGRAGWMAVCDDCHLQVKFFVEILN